ncbi:DNA polymerase B-like protein [Enterococcus phage vB_EfaS_785CS]|uniref:DNA polymerase B-like protein n=1 Tax=Enterococcus phage vB_EfaS_785CS TaxID=2836121 RepID=A0A8E7D9P7_9CAUD|nr:DNA polymerase B-like protein [Enterococcus phage vB_EfaS_785CS]
MKNIAEFKNAPELAEKLLEVFSNLKGNSRSLDPMRAGQHDVVVIESTEKLSAKGKEMKVVKMRSLEDGRDVTSYIMKFRKYDWDKWKNVEVGDRLLIDLKFSNGFATVKPIRSISSGNVVPFKPSEPLTKQTILLFDIEIFKHDSLFVFRDYFTKEWVIINNNLDELRKFYLEYRDSMFIGYNNASYDNNVMRGYLQGKNAYQMSKAIIESDNRGLVYKMFDSHKTPLFGMDLYQDNKGFSLKEHSAFLGINIKETEVDFDMDRPLTEEEKAKNIAYCKNDVLATEKRFEQNISMLLAKATIALMFDMDKTDLLQPMLT